MELHVITSKNRYVLHKADNVQMFTELATDDDKLEYFKDLLDADPTTAYNIYNNIEITGE